jgi:hypothetical protein
MKKISTILLITLIALLASYAHAAGLYKWKDAEGNIYFSDKVPPKNSSLERSVLNEKGRIIDIKDAAKTPDELIQFKRIKALQKTKQAMLEEQLEKDAFLLKLYRTEADVDSMVMSKSSMINTHIDVAKLQTPKLKAQLVNSQKQAANFERSGKEVPQDTLEKIQASKTKLDTNHKEIVIFEQQLVTLAEQGSIDKARLIMLDRSRRAIPLVYTGGRASLKLGELQCMENNCNSVWAKASQFIKEHVSKKIIFESKQLVLTKAPKSGRDIALSLTTVTTNNKSSVVLDVRCLDGLLGRKTCQSDATDTLIESFNSL